MQRCTACFAPGFSEAHGAMAFRPIEALDRARGQKPPKEEGTKSTTEERHEAGRLRQWLRVLRRARDCGAASIGLSICYDVRFPALYRDLASAGAAILSVPSAFTYDSGRAHWHVLLRARAIENGCFVIAPAQCGTHADGRRTYGHALIINPWGEIMAEAETDDDVADPGANDDVIFADIDLDAVQRARRAIPSLSNARPYMT